MKKQKPRKYGKRLMRDWARSAVVTVKRKRKRRDLFAEARPLIEQWRREQKALNG